MKLNTRRLATALHRRSIERFWFELAEALCAYFRVDAGGLERIPREGPVIITPNHSGYAAADAIVLAHLVRARLRRDVRVLAHPFFFSHSSTMRAISVSFGLRRASLEEAIHLLDQGCVLIVFPEAERGNFKSSLKRYRLQKFHTGFVRMALVTGATIVPCAIIGAEESHWNWGSFKLPVVFPGLRVPVPINFFPLPARWRIRVLKPYKLQLPRGMGPKAKDRWISRVAAEKQDALQRALDSELRERGSVFVPRRRR